MGNLTRSQIDKLGDRLKMGAASDEDIRLLNDFRNDFAKVVEHISGTIENKLELNPVWRPGKSTPSIVAKLLRSSTKLSQMQDIAGCRLIVDNLAEQTDISNSIALSFEDSRVIDRRVKPSFGYRAIHVVVKVGGKPVEIQVRTALQHAWAQMTEKLADVFGQDIKYGGGSTSLGIALETASKLVESLEMLELEHRELMALEARILEKLPETNEAVQDIRRATSSLAAKIREFRNDITRQFSDIVREVTK